MTPYTYCGELEKPFEVTLPEGKVFMLSGWAPGQRQVRWVCVDTGEPVGSASTSPGMSVAQAAIKEGMPRTFRLEGNRLCFDWVRELLFYFGLTRSAAPQRSAAYSVVEL